jgi:hypothetical protein
MLLPSPRQFSAHIFNPEFKRFLEIVKSTPTEKHSHHVRNDSPAIDLRVDYEPGASGGIGVATYGMYTSTTVRDDNPLYNALKHKADQLRRGGFPGVRGVIVCDRACQIFHESRNWATYSMDEIVGEFFRQNDSVAFVITLGIKSAGNGLEYRPNLFVRELGPPWISGLGRLLKNVLSSLPPPCETPGNALNDLKWNKSTKRTRPYIGGWELQGNRIRMSTREVLDLLAGVLDQKRFCERYEVAGGNIFSRFRAEGKMISRAEVERRPEKDEDWIILEFSADDPAVSDFKVPKSPGR